MPKRKNRLTKDEDSETVCLSTETFRAIIHKGGTLPKIPLQGLVFGGEFAYIAKATAKKRAAKKATAPRTRKAKPSK